MTAPPDATTLTRTELVWPGMCGHNSLFAGQIGDWTWDAVGRLCGTDVLRARNPAGQPTYLSFYYYRIRGSRRFHLRSPTFGDRLRISTGLFDFGSESVLALHVITPAGDAGPGGPFDPDRFYRFDEENCLYVENFNRWVTRGTVGSNEGLVRSSPADFRHRHLPALPDRHSPRVACHRARTHLSFVDPGSDAHARDGDETHTDFEVDPTSDLNGVGLLYFASYFSMVDRALLRMWRGLGRSERSFLDRIVVDQQLCYLGNADAGCVVAAAVRRWRVVGDDGRELFDVVLRDRGTGRVLAICTLTLLTGDTP